MADIDKARDLLIKTAFDYGCGVWLLLDAGRLEEAEDCAYDAWAAREAATADDPWERWKVLYRARHGNGGEEGAGSAPRLRLVVDNTRMLRPG